MKPLISVTLLGALLAGCAAAVSTQTDLFADRSPDCPVLNYQVTCVKDSATGLYYRE